MMVPAPCNFDWVKSLRQECVDANVTFCFIETGTVFIKDAGATTCQTSSCKAEWPVNPA